MDLYEENISEIQEEPVQHEPAPDEEGGGSRAGRFILTFLMGVLFTLVIATGILWLGKGHFRLITGEQIDYYQNLEETCGKYYETLKMIGDDPLVDKDLAEFTDEDIREIVKTISDQDPYAQYFTKEEYEAFLNSFVGDYVGVGIGIVNVDDKVTIKSVFNDGPAEEAGIKMDDVIVRVDGKEVKSVEGAVSLITGEAGTSVTITVLREGQEMDFTLERAKLDQESGIYYEREENPEIGYISIISFVKETDADFKMAVKELENKGCNRFIIDLRGNGGGLTDSSVKVADYLLPSCTIMTDVLKDGTETVYSSEESSAEIEYVVLVNEYTASASEILTAAIQDNHGAKIIGTKTYGKGVTQSVHKFNDGSALKYTVSEYYRPNGDKVQGIGITPDIKADNDNIMDKAFKELGD